MFCNVSAGNDLHQSEKNDNKTTIKKKGTCNIEYELILNKQRCLTQTDSPENESETTMNRVGRFKSG